MIERVAEFFNETGTRVQFFADGHPLGDEQVLRFAGASMYTVVKVEASRKDPLSLAGGLATIPLDRYVGSAGFRLFQALAPPSQLSNPANTTTTGNCTCPQTQRSSNPAIEGRSVWLMVGRGACHVKLYFYPYLNA